MPLPLLPMLKASKIEGSSIIAARINAEIAAYRPMHAPGFSLLVRGQTSSLSLPLSLREDYTVGFCKALLLHVLGK